MNRLLSKKDLILIPLFLIFATSLAYIYLQLVDITGLKSIALDNINTYCSKVYALKDFFIKPNSPPILVKRTPGYGQDIQAADDNPQPQVQQTEQDWGVAKKIGEHTYTIKVGSDDRMSTPNEIYEALNAYRDKHRKGFLSWNNTLADYAQTRADFFETQEGTDEHAGFSHFLDNEDGFSKLGFSHLGENSYYGAPLLGVHVIEWIFASSVEHNSNQLDSSWSHVGIGSNSSAVNIVFGGSKR